MARFVTLTDSSGDPVTVNMDTVVFMQRHDPKNPHTALTTLLPTGERQHILSVKESVDNILTLLS
jgi:hypothetical protein